MMKTLRDHLSERRLNPALYSGVSLDEENTVATFPLWNLSGRMVGFQQYRPLTPKSNQSKPNEQRYFTVASKVGKVSELLVFGTERLSHRNKVLFVAEGVFDVSPLHARNSNALGMLTNNPKHLYEFVRSLGYHVVALCEGDRAGKAMANLGNEVVYLPEGKDPADMPDSWLDDLANFYR